MSQRKSPFLVRGSSWLGPGHLWKFPQAHQCPRQVKAHTVTDFHSGVCFSEHGEGGLTTVLSGEMQFSCREVRGTQTRVRQSLAPGVPDWGRALGASRPGRTARGAAAGSPPPWWDACRIRVAATCSRARGPRTKRWGPALPLTLVVTTQLPGINLRRNRLPGQV